MITQNTYSNDYRIMTFKLTGREVTAVQHAIRREIARLNEYIQNEENYRWNKNDPSTVDNNFRNDDIATMKMLMSLIADLHDHTIKP